MNKLTDRLQLIANQITEGETMADIGTDHGFLPLYLLEHGISDKVIMCDISEPSLDKARQAAKYYVTETGEDDDTLAFRAGDGLKVLDFAEVDTVVIAGMGGNLIRDILSDDIAKSKSFKSYVFQPRNNCGNLRFWLANNGFDITNNLLVREGKFICEIICAKPIEGVNTCGIETKVSVNMDAGILLGEEEKHASWDFPEDLIKNQSELAIEYLKIKLGIEKKILEGMLRGKEKSSEEISVVEDRIKYFEKLLNDYGIPE